MHGLSLNVFYACCFQASTEMARAATIESVGETAGAGNGPLSHHNICRMELNGPSFHNWPGLLITTGSGPAHFHYNHHHLHPLQAVYLSCPLPCSHPEGQDELQTHQQGPAVSPSPTPPPPCNQREEVDAGFSGQQPGNIFCMT